MPDPAKKRRFMELLRETRSRHPAATVDEIITIALASPAPSFFLPERGLLKKVEAIINSEPPSRLISGKERVILHQFIIALALRGAISPIPGCHRAAVRPDILRFTARNVPAPSFFYTRAYARKLYYSN